MKQHDQSKRRSVIILLLISYILFVSDIQQSNGFSSTTDSKHNYRAFQNIGSAKRSLFGSSRRGNNNKDCFANNFRHRQHHSRLYFSPFSIISRLWVNASSRSKQKIEPAQDLIDDEDISLANKTKSELLEEAERLKAKANAIRAEARIMEIEIQEHATKRLQTQLLETNTIISTLFDPKLSISYSATTSAKETDTNSAGESSSSTMNDTVSSKDKDIIPNSIIPDIRVVADRLRTGKYTQEQIIKVIDRLFDLQLQASGQPSVFQIESIPTFQIGSPTNVQLQINETLHELYADYIETLAQAAALVDDDQITTPDSYTIPSTATTSTRPSSTSSPIMQPSSASGIAGISSGRLEIAIQTRLKELRKIQELNRNRRLAAIEMKKVDFTNSRGGGGTVSIEDFIQQSILGLKKGIVDNSNITRSFNMSGNMINITQITTTSETTSIVPLWVPSTFLPYILSSNVSTVGPDEVNAIKNRVLMGSRFYMTSSEYVPGAAIFRGNIRPSLAAVNMDDKTNNPQRISSANNSTAVVFQEIQNRLKNAGLGDKVQLFLMSDPDFRPQSEGKRPAIVAATEDEAKPVILALSKALSPDESLMKKSWLSRIGKTLCYPLAAISTFYYSVNMFALNPSFFDSLVYRRDLKALYACIPVAFGTMAIQAIHEAAHYLAAKRRKLKIGLPVPIPSTHPSAFPFFGCITPLRSFPSNRAALLDFALSGPISAITASLGLVIGGVLLTTKASPFEIARFPTIPVMSMKSSFLLGSILSWLAPKTMMLPLAQPIPMHPCFIVGVSGLISNALNLLPIFRLDGGRACFAALGQRQGAVISVFTLLLIISMVLSGASPIFLTWTLLVAVLQRRQEIPPRDDVTEVDGTRMTIWLLSFLLSISILTPFPGFSL